MSDTVGIMLQNSLVQTGTPQQIYTAPESIEVARFLGDINVLEGTATRRSGECELGKLALSKTFGHKEKVNIVIRPESIRLNNDSSESVQARIISVEFRGTYKTVVLALPSGQFLTSIMGIHIDAEVGTEVPISVNSAVSAFPI